jgi:hypothetical protein
MTELPNIMNFVSRAAQECGFEREKFVDSKLPQDFDKIVVILFLGDIRSTVIMSMMLFSQFRDTILKDKYVILCSYPGMSSLFPKADEYWSISDALAISSLMQNANGFGNSDKKFDALGIQLRRRFFTVLTHEDFLTFYEKGLTTKFFDRFGKVERFLPQLPNWRGGEFNMALAQRGGTGIFVYPNTHGRCYDGRGKEISVKFSKDFWIKLVERLISHKFVPVIYQNQASYDLSQHFGERCFYCSERNIQAVLSAMRSTGCVLDVFSGISRLSVVARCPFLAVDERQRYIKTKEFEINDLCITGMYPYRYIFSFPTIISNENYNEVIDQIINVLLKFSKEVAKVQLPPSAESSEQIPYEIVRKHKAKKLGVHFIKVERLVVE